MSIFLLASTLLSAALWRAVPHRRLLSTLLLLVFGLGFLSFTLGAILPQLLREALVQFGSSLQVDISAQGLDQLLSVAEVLQSQVPTLAHGLCGHLPLRRAVGLLVDSVRGGCSIPESSTRLSTSRLLDGAPLWDLT